MKTFDPQYPQNGQNADADKLRAQLNALKGLIDAIPPTQKGDKGDPGLAGPPGPQGPAGSTAWGFTWQGDWSAQVYGAGCVVLYNGALYLATQMCGPDAPGVDPHWQQLSIVGPAGRDGTDGAPGPQGPQGEVSAGDLNNALATTSANSNGVALIAAAPNDPPTAADWQVLADKMNELIVALRR